LKQIQEEEESRKAKAAAQLRAAQIAAGVAAAPKRGYADLAAAPSPQATGQGWTTVGASGKTASTSLPSPVPTSTARVAIAKLAVPSSIPAKPPAASIPVTTAAQRLLATASTPADATPSPDFIKWTKTALTGLNVPSLDDFITMLLTFPVDPPATEKAGMLEIISDSVYEHSKTLDGRRFAQEYVTRRKADAQRPKGLGDVRKVNGTSMPGSLADVVKLQPKAPSADAGFKVVKAKGKKKN